MECPKWVVKTRHWGSNFLKEKYTMNKYGITGPYYSYHADGKLYIKCGYRNGLLNGDYYEYSKRGILMMAHHYVNGLPHGECKLYNHDSKTLFSTTQFKMGKRHGPHIVYGDNGVPIIKSWWHDDKLVCHYEGELTDKEKFIIEMTGKAPCRKVKREYTGSMIRSIVGQEINNEEDE